MDNKERVKDAIDIVSYIQTNGVALKKEGRLFVGLCPFHTEKSGSFKVYPETQSYTCFGGCNNAGGDVFTFAQKRHNWTFPEALEELARYANITLEPLTPEHKAQADKRERLYALLNHTMRFFNKHLHDNDAALDYVSGTRKLANSLDMLGYAPNEWQRLYTHLQSHGYSDDEMRHAGVCAKSDKTEKLYDFFRGRIMIPIHDAKGRVVGFSGRAFDEGVEPKYKNSPECEMFHKSSLVHKMPLNQSTIGFKAFDTIIVVEGTIDPLTGANAGFHNIASQMGTSLSDEQLDILCKGETKRLIFCLDNDAAGDTALRRLVEKHIHRAAAKGVALYAMTAPYGKDADDTLREHPEMWQGAVDAARPVVEVLVTREFKKLGDQATGAEKSNLARELLPILRSDDPFIQQENIAILSRQTDLPIDTLEAWLIGQSKIRVLPKIVLPTTQEPPLETSILWGIIFNAHDGWLQRANAALIRLSPLDKPLLYAFAPLNALDFTHAPYQDLMGKVASGLDELEQTVINTHLESVYRRVMFAPPVTSMFKADMPDEQPRETCDEFIDNVLLLRLNRLKADMVARKNFGEVMRGMALIQQKREIQIGG
jgi:DNA primase